MLQSPQMDILKVQQHMRLLTETIGEHRAKAEEVFRDLYSANEETAGQIGAEVSVPRVNMYRPNTLGTSEEYYRRNIFIPYLDSLLLALEEKFGERNTPAFALLLLHPNALRKLSNENLMKQLCEPVNKYFDFDNFDCEVELWRRSWMKTHFDGDLIDLTFAEGIYPAISRALPLDNVLSRTFFQHDAGRSVRRSAVRRWKSVILPDHQDQSSTTSGNSSASNECPEDPKAHKSNLRMSKALSTSAKRIQKELAEITLDPPPNCRLFLVFLINIRIY
ncbi:hypothetical protein MTO96_011905 [Rhipicephalus appendiculatus]